MVIKNYNVSLDDEIVNKAKEMFQNSGTKLSPLINSLLKNWIETQEKKSNG